MSVRVRYAVAAAVSSSSAEERDLGNVKLEVVTDDETKGGAWKTELLAGQTNIQLYMDNITTVQLLIIRTTSKDPNINPAAITIKRNGTGNEPIQISPLSSTKEGIFLISTDGLTSLFGSNASTVDMNLTILACGV